MSSSAPGSNGRLPACIDRISISDRARSSSRVRRFLWRLNLVSACTFRRICSAFIWRGSLRLRIGESVSPDQIVFETVRVCKIVLHTRSDPGLALLRVRLSDHQATLAAQRRSELRHHLLRDVNASDILFVSSLLSVPASTSGFTIGMYLAGAAGLGSTSTRPSCNLHGFPSSPNSISRFQRSPLFRLRMLRHDTTAALLLTMC